MQYKFISVSKPKLVYVRSVVEKMALRWVFLRVLHFSCRCHSANVCTDPCLNSIPVRRKNGWSLGTFTQSDAVSDIRRHWAQKYFHILFYSWQFTWSLLVQGWRGTLVREIYSHFFSISKTLSYKLQVYSVAFKQLTNVECQKILTK